VLFLWIHFFISTYGIAYGAAIFLDTRYKIQSYCKSNFRVAVTSLMQTEFEAFFPPHGPKKVSLDPGMRDSLISSTIVEDLSYQNESRVLSHKQRDI